MTNILCLLGIHDYEEFGDVVAAEDIIKEAYRIIELNAKMAGFEGLDFGRIEHCLNHKWSDGYKVKIDDSDWRVQKKVCLRCGKISDRDVRKHVDAVYKRGFSEHNRQIRSIKRKIRAKELSEK